MMIDTLILTINLCKINKFMFTDVVMVCNLIYNFMGQYILEGCQTTCQQLVSGNRIKSKSSIYLNNMTAQLPNYLEKDNYMMKSIKSVIDIKKVPMQYIQYVNYLFNNKSKFEDQLFPPQRESISWSQHQQQNQWARLDQLNQLTLSIYKDNYKSFKSKVNQVLTIIQEYFPFLIQKIKPLYIPKVGLALCVLHINGIKQQILIDDFIPACKFKYYKQQQKWYLMIQKAFAKILGNYEFIEEFTIAEIYQEITGLPYDIQQQIYMSAKSDINCSTTDNIQSEINIDLKMKRQNKLCSFRQAINNQKILIKDDEKDGQVYCFSCSQKYTLKSIPLSFLQKPIFLFKFKIDEPQQISIRLSLLNKKYELQDNKTNYPQFEMKLYKESQIQTYQQKIITSFLTNNNIYVGNTFIELEQGLYLLYLRNNTKLKKTSLIFYSKQILNIRQVHSRQNIKDICQNLPLQNKSIQLTVNKQN